MDKVAFTQLGLSRNNYEARLRVCTASNFAAVHISALPPMQALQAS